MDRDKVFVELIKGLLSNPSLVKDKYVLNYDSSRNSIIDMAKAMTNLAMVAIREIKDEDEI